ncbi:unnamed protein product [Pieris macdunnoughi]|uniref:Uncharacterized protein n=1 Tax=Pieris macdunnoughi TaxID=345717 RepID=A0A821TU82_9NEOP|nr:unnamed protein product [Pieris macdunnoughi]
MKDSFDLNSRKTREMRCRATSTYPLLIEQARVVPKFTYLGSIFTETGENGITFRITKADGQYQASLVITEVNTTSQTKSYDIERVDGGETWKVTKTTTQQHQIFVRCLCQILGIFSPRESLIISYGKV